MSAMSQCGRTVSIERVEAEVRKAAGTFKIIQVPKEHGIAVLLWEEGCIDFRFGTSFCKSLVCFAWPFRGDVSDRRRELYRIPMYYLAESSIEDLFLHLIVGKHLSSHIFPLPDVSDKNRVRRFLISASCRSKKHFS